MASSRMNQFADLVLFLEHGGHFEISLCLEKNRFSFEFVWKCRGASILASGRKLIFIRPHFDQTRQAKWPQKHD